MLKSHEGRVVQIFLWGNMPYILESELQRIIDDLPEASSTGRDGKQSVQPIAARVCRSFVPMSETRAHLRHSTDYMLKPKLNNVCSKYKNLPDMYYGGDPEQFVTPEKFDKESKACLSKTCR